MIGSELARTTAAPSEIEFDGKRFAVKYTVEDWGVAANHLKKARQKEILDLIVMQKDSLPHDLWKEVWSEAFEQAKALADLLPAGSPLSVEGRQRQEAGGFGDLVKPELSFGATEPGGLPNVPVEAGMPIPGMGAPRLGSPGVIDTGRGTSIATESSATRRSEATQNAAMARTMARLQSQQWIAGQRNTLLAKRADWEQKLREAELDVRKTAVADQLRLGLARIDVDLQRLEQGASEFEAGQERYYGLGADERTRALDISEYRALHPPAQGGGASLDTMARGIAGGGSAAPAPTAPTVPPAGGDVRSIPSTGGKRRMWDVETGYLKEYDPATKDWSLVTPLQKKPTKKQ